MLRVLLFVTDAAKSLAPRSRQPLHSASLRPSAHTRRRRLLYVVISQPRGSERWSTQRLFDLSGEHPRSTPNRSRVQRASASRPSVATSRGTDPRLAARGPWLARHSTSGARDHRQDGCDGAGGTTKASAQYSESWRRYSLVASICPVVSKFFVNT